MLLPAKVVVAQVPCEGNFDCDLDVDGTDASVFKSDFGRSKFSNPCPNCDEPPVPIPKTGQTTSYHDADDGWMEKGVPWPNPRFTDNGDGTVTDNMTWLIWLKDAYCPDVQAPDWNQAVDAAFNLHGQCTGQYPGITSRSSSRAARGRRWRRRTTCAPMRSSCDPTWDAATSRSGPTASAAATCGRSMRRFFEVDRYYVAVAALTALAEESELERKVVADAIRKYRVDPEKPNPATL